MDIGKGDFYWFVGVVEDRNDPEEMGRVRVRALGFHTDDKVAMPTESLPWSHVLMPSNSASAAGIGQSATGIVQGSWVIGYYIDGDNLQQPFVLGTIPSMPQLVTNNDKGFSDPDKVHPVRDDYTDQPYSAGEFYRDHVSYVQKADSRQEDIETSVPPKLDTVALEKPESYYERKTWSMPNLGGAPIYPYNKVQETEGGHVFEIDDTPNKKRISQFHASGTNYEIQDNGDQSFTVVGDRYSVVFGTDNIYVKGNVNMTVDGDMRQLVKGNYHLEVEKDYSINVKGSRLTNINNNDQIEIGQEFASNVNVNYSQRIGGDEIRIVDGLRNTTIGNTEDLTVSKDIGIVSLSGLLDIFAAKDTTITTGAKLIVKSKGDMELRTSADQIIEVGNKQTIEAKGGGTDATHFKNNIKITGTSTATTDHLSNGISGNSHTHTDTAGTGAGTTSPPN